MVFNTEPLASRLKRGLWLVGALILLDVSVAAANGQFNIDIVAATAKKLAAEPFKPPQSVPDYLTQISYDDYRDIRFDTEQSLWNTGNNFQIQFIHPGLYYTHSVAINTLEAQGVRKVAFSRTMFSYGKNKFADKIPDDLGFAGFRLAYPLYKKMSITTWPSSPVQATSAQSQRIRYLACPRAASPSTLAYLPERNFPRSENSGWSGRRQTLAP